MIVGEGLKSASQADVAMDLIAREFGLTPLDGKLNRAAETSPDDYNLLAAD